MSPAPRLLTFCLHICPANGLHFYGAATEKKGPPLTAATPPLKILKAKALIPLLILFPN